MKLSPKNWDEFQHYKKRNPPWIRLYNRLLNDYNFHRLHVASRALAPMLWLLASEYDDGDISADPVEIAFRVRQPESVVATACLELIAARFFYADQEFTESCKQIASATLGRCNSDANPETEAETEAEFPTKEGIVTTDGSNNYQGGVQ